jgi:hypothetical protein
MAFDQYMALYTYATVVSSRIDVQAYQSTGVPIVCGVALCPLAAAAYTLASAYVEAGLSKPILIGADDGTSDIRLSAAYNAGKYYRLDNVVSEPEYANSDSANPTIGPYYQLFLQDVNLTSTATLQALVTIAYDVVFTVPRKLAGS